MDNYLLQLIPGAYTQIDLSDGAVHGFDADVIDPPNDNMGPGVVALVSPEGGNIRWRVDGTDPTTDTGMYVRNGDVMSLHGNTALRGFKAIKVVGTTVKLNVQMYHH